MRLIVFILVGMLPCICFADRVCIEKNTGKLIEYQSGDAPLGVLTQNAVNQGYKANNVVEKYVTPKEWERIKYDQITKPAEDKVKIKNQKKQSLRNKLKTRFSLTDEDLDLLLND